MEASKKEMTYEQIRAARLALKEGDRVMISVSFSENFGWNGKVELKFWDEVSVERATKTTVTAGGVTFMRESGCERGGKRRLAVWGEQKANTPTEIANGEKEIAARRALRYRATQLDKEIDAAACDVNRLKGLSDINKVNDLIAQIEAIIGKSEKKRY